jgi:hypothetical protein
MDADYLFYVKNIETHARAFLPLNISAIGTVFFDTVSNFNQIFTKADPYIFSIEYVWYC